MSGGGGAPRSAYADSGHINKLESEITDIKSMLNEYGVRNADRRDKLSQLLDDDDQGFENTQDNGSSKDFVRQQK